MPKTKEELIDEILLEVRSNIYNYQEWLLDVLAEHLEDWRLSDLERFVTPE